MYIWTLCVNAVSMWVLGAYLGSSARTASALDCRAISPASWNISVSSSSLKSCPCAYQLFPVHVLAMPFCCFLGSLFFHWKLSCQAIVTSLKIAFFKIYLFFTILIDIFAHIEEYSVIIQCTGTTWSDQSRRLVFLSPCLSSCSVTELETLPSGSLSGSQWAAAAPLHRRTWALAPPLLSTVFAVLTQLGSHSIGMQFWKPWLSGISEVPGHSLLTGW